MAILAGVLTAMAMLGWYWPRDETQET